MRCCETFRRRAGLAGLLGILLLASGPAGASSLADEKDQLRRQAVETLVTQLGLRESAVPSRDLPGWREVKRVVARYPAERIDELRAVAPESRVKELVLRLGSRPRGERSGGGR